MFFPFLKIVKKILTRWSQVTKKVKDKTNPEYQAPKENNKEDNHKN